MLVVAHTLIHWVDAGGALWLRSGMLQAGSRWASTTRCCGLLGRSSSGAPPARSPVRWHRQAPNCAASASEMVQVHQHHAADRRNVRPDAVLASTGEVEEHTPRVSMSLSSVGNPAWQSIRGVRFAMRNGPTLVAILVTHEAVDDVEKATAGDGGPLARFNKHRDRLEVVPVV